MNDWMRFLRPRNYITRLAKLLLAPSLQELGFLHYYTPHVWGPRDRLVLKDARTCSLANTLFNTRSGCIYLDEHVRFSHNCMVLTGTHNYQDKDVHAFHEVPQEHRDIRIGCGSWIASGAIVLGGVTIGRHCVIAAGAVVTKDVPDDSFAAGIPATVKRRI